MGHLDGLPWEAVHNRRELAMRELAWAVMFMMPLPEAAFDKLVVYTFSTHQECARSIPGIKRKHRLFFKELTCVQMDRDT